MSTTTSHTGGCHCGAVRYRVDIDLTKPVIQCNCSICSRTGTLLAFVPESSFKLEKGEENLTDYQFNSRSFITCSARTAVSAPSRAAPVRAVRWWRSTPAASTTWMRPR